jgi:hypothetical protein
METKFIASVIFSDALSMYTDVYSFYELSDEIKSFTSYLDSSTMHGSDSSSFMSVEIAAFSNDIVQKIEHLGSGDTFAASEKIYSFATYSTVDIGAAEDFIVSMSSITDYLVMSDTSNIESDVQIDD